MWSLLQYYVSVNRCVSRKEYALLPLLAITANRNYLPEQVHLGFILKTSLNELSEGAALMQAGLDSEEPGTQDARFFFHLGDALQRLARPQEALQVTQLSFFLGETIN